MSILIFSLRYIWADYRSARKHNREATPDDIVMIRSLRCLIAILTKRVNNAQDAKEKLGTATIHNAGATRKKLQAVLDYEL